MLHSEQVSLRVLCTGGKLEARDLPLCYEHFEACSRAALEGVAPSGGNTGTRARAMFRAFWEAWLAPVATRTCSTVHSCILSHYTVISPDDENVNLPLRIKIFCSVLSEF